MTINIKTYHYYLAGGLAFVAWIVIVMTALEVAVNVYP